MKSLLIAVMLLGSVQARAALKTGALRSFSLDQGGQKRTYQVYAPAGRRKDAKSQLLVVLHGAGGNSDTIRTVTRNVFERIADSNGALVAYPDAREEYWNYHRDGQDPEAQRKGADDIAFIAAMLDAIAREYPVDEHRVYAAGMSNGAMMVHTLACRAADRFASVAAVSGALSETLAADCKPSRPVPIIMISGTKDDFVPWGGGDVRTPLGKKKRGKVLSAERTRDFWLARNSCDAAKKEVTVRDVSPDDGTSLSREVYRSCADGSGVDFLRVEGGGHAWPGGRMHLPPEIAGKTSREFDASLEIWGFLGRFDLKKGPRP